MLRLVLLVVAAETITLEDALDRAVEAGSAAAASRRAEAADARASAAWRAAFLPTLGGEAGYGVRDRDLTLTTPVGAFELGQRDQWSAVARLTVPIVRPGRILAAPAASAAADAERAQAEDARQRRSAEVVDAYYGWLSLSAEAEANTVFIRSLEQRRDAVRAMVEGGRAVEADLLRVELALDEATLGGRRIDAGLEATALNLARLVGAPDAVTPIDPRVGARTREAREAWIERALSARSDVKATRAAQDALEASKRAVWAEYLPDLEARGEVIIDNAAIYDETVFFRGSVHLVWTPLAALTRPARASEKDAEARGVAAQLAELERAVVLEVTRAWRELEIAHEAQAIAERGLVQAQVVVKNERLRFDEGRVTTADLLEAEALARNRSAAAARATWSVRQAEAHLALAAGTLTTQTVRGDADRQGGKR